ncbi:hypothetical protein T10_6439 [Trichinella papuae]|uniref:Uncharacterized protein n=1 Tax=Trichinella papuae TaxID=268474 RepID=A0A0V1MBS7_9BILA|nr:hypothetical protein T10_6439 [Trichinella papuae]
MRHGILGSVFSVRSFLELLENHNSASVSSRLPFNAAPHVCCSEREQCGNHSSSHVDRIAQPAIWSSQSRRPEAHRQDDPAAALCTCQLEKLTLDTYRDYQALASVQRFLPKKISRKNFPQKAATFLCIRIGHVPNLAAIYSKITGYVSLKRPVALRYQSMYPFQ